MKICDTPENERGGFKMFQVKSYEKRLRAWITLFTASMKPIGSCAFVKVADFLSHSLTHSAICTILRTETRDMEVGIISHTSRIILTGQLCVTLRLCSGRSSRMRRGERIKE